MGNRIKFIRIRNYRSLAEVDLTLGPVSVLFGPNGSGKSTFLDTLRFVRDCAVRGVEYASAGRNHGIGLLTDSIPPASNTIRIMIQTDCLEYSLHFDLSSGRIGLSPGEYLVNLNSGEPLIKRDLQDDQVGVKFPGADKLETLNVRHATSLTFDLYLTFNREDRDVATFDEFLSSISFYDSRSMMLRRLKERGSESGYETRLAENGENLWSVLRNLHDRKHVDGRFDTIMDYMREAFPSFDGIVLEQTGPNSVYAQFLEKGRSRPILASGVSDGHLQLLLILTALFSEGPDREALILLDEPEISLHPWALAVLARAIRTAGADWNKQVVVATHSPVLLSQFEPEEIIVAEVEQGETKLRRLSEIADADKEFGDLLDEYAAGSLYMAQVIGAQTPPEPVGGTADE